MSPPLLSRKAEEMNRRIVVPRGNSIREADDLGGVRKPVKSPLASCRIQLIPSLADGEQGCLYEVVDLQFVEKFFDAKLPHSW